jgi:hypothetical protein
MILISITRTVWVDAGSRVLWVEWVYGIWFYLVTFQVLTATRMKMTVLQNIAPCGQVDIDRRFIETYCLHHQGPNENSKLL